MRPAAHRCLRHFLSARIWVPGILSAGLVAFVHAQTIGPVSPYYLTAGDQRDILVLQGSSVVATYPTVSTSSREYPIIVLGSVIRTDGPNSGEPGYEYTLAGTPTGTSYAVPSIIQSAWDATTDGTHIYLMDYSAGIVYQTDLDYTNPVALFSGLGSGAFLGITYDPTNNSLWLSGWTSNLVSNYTLSGTLLSSFNAGISSLTSLALDPATGTLWMGSQQNEGTFYEYSKSGTLLQTVVYPGLTSQNTLGGEFAFSAIPEPSTTALFATGIFAVVLGNVARCWRRSRRDA
jgi:hypothetical protein